MLHSRLLLFLGLLGAAVALFDYPTPHQRYRFRRYAPPRNSHHLLQDTLFPVHYDLTIRPDIYQEREEDFKFDGNVTIFFDCRRSTNRIKLHSTELKIDPASIRLSGDQDRLVVTGTEEDKDKSFVTFHLNKRLKRGRHYVIRLSFSGRLRVNLKGLYLTGYMVNQTRHYMAITQMEPNDARRMFPCFDEPALKATFNVTVLRKSSHVALSNMPLIKSALLANGWYADTFDKTPTMPTYLVAIAVTDYKFKQGYTKHGIKIRAWWREDELHKVDHALAKAIQSTEWFTEYTGINYTLPKMDNIAVPDFSHGGMENWGLVTYTLMAILYDPATDGEWRKGFVTSVTVHEVAHQWFGNLVTAKWWNEIWINEALTAYMSIKCQDDVMPERDMMVEHLTTRRRALNTDSYHTSHPIDYSVIRQSELEKVFDSITYGKGALILLMLDGVIGPKEFRRGIQIFLQTHQFGNADQYDLYDAFNEALHNTDKDYLRGVDIGEFMPTWIKQAGFPVLDIRRDGKRILVNQSRFLVDPTVKIPDEFKSPFGYVWIIPLFLSTNATGKAVQTPPVWMHDVELDISKDVNFAKADETAWILGNHGLKGYYIVNYDERNWQLLSDQLLTDHTVIPTISRVQLIDDTYSLAKAGQLHLTHALHFMRYLRKEKEEHPWTMFFANFGRIGEKLRKTINYGLLRSFVLELVGHKFDDITWDKADKMHDLSRVDQAIVSGACQFDYQPCLKKMTEFYRNANVLPLPKSIRYAVFCSVIRVSTVDVWDDVYTTYLDRLKEVNGIYDELTADLQRSLACSNEEWVLRRYLNRELDRNAANLYGIFSSVAENPAGSHLALEVYLERWNETKDLYVLNDVCSRLASQDDLDTLLKFLEANPEEKTGDYEYMINRSIEDMKASIVWLENHGQKVVDWLREVYAPADDKS